MHKPTFRQRLQYSFDNWMSQGPSAMIAILGIVSLLLILIAAVILTLTGFHQVNDGPLTFGEALWESLMRTLDPGTMGGDTGTGFRAVMLMVTIGGIFIVSALIGILNNGLQDNLERLRRGRSQVLESGHTVILGWSFQIFTILQQLLIANENKKQASIVILANEEKASMEDTIRERVKLHGHTCLICRSGNPMDPADLDIVSLHTARSIIVLPPEHEDPDADVIKSVLAVTNHPHRRPEPYSIVTQIRNEESLDILQMISQRDRVMPLLTGDLIARIIAQTSRQSGLSAIYTELLNFEGDEIYFKHEPALTGLTYGEALLHYEDSALMGLRRADGTLLLNPAMDTRIAADDQIFALSEDNETIHLSGLSRIPLDESLIHLEERARPPQAERDLLLGWNESAPAILRELDAYVAPGSQITVVADVERIAAEIQNLLPHLKQLHLEYRPANPADGEVLERLDLSIFDHVIVLACSGFTPQQADARTLLTLLHLRRIAERDQTPFSIVSEMLDLRNRQLAEVARVDDFIVSDHLVSLLMAQLSETPERYPIFRELFDPEGAEIYLKPADEYVVTGVPVSFYTVVEAARRRGHTAIGYR
ncbi:MAG: CASTOR/POLLUX-related putative ion channel, partial [Anaerolineae bacterium]